MARKAGNSIQRPALLQVTNGGVPSSTIAAQIVNNASNVNAEPGTKAVFGQLLQEYLHDPSTDEPSSQLNAQLIGVVAEAGLDVLLHDNPFALDLLILQAIDSLSVIRLILQRRPQLLFSARAEDYGLLCHPNLGGLQTHVQDLLSFCVQLTQRTQELWRRASTLIQLYRSCVESISKSLDVTEASPRLSRLTFKAELPPSSGISDFWPASQQLVALPHGLQRNITSRLQAVMTALGLLEIIRTSGTHPTSAIIFSCDHSSQWTLDHYADIWRIFKSGRNAKDIVESQDLIESSFLTALSAICFGTMPSSRYPLQSEKAAICMGSVISDVLIAGPLDIKPQTTQLQVALCLVRLRQTVEGPSIESVEAHRSSTKVQRLITDRIESAVVHALHGLTSLDDVTDDLQLALCLWMSEDSCPEPCKEIYRSLVNDQTKSFGNPELQSEFQMIARTFKQRTATNQDRPQKRPRLDNGTYQDEQRVIYDHFITQITNILSKSPNSGVEKLQVSAAECYGKLSGAQQDVLFSESALGKVACAGSLSLEVSGDADIGYDTLPCKFCDAASASPVRIANMYWNTSQLELGWKEVLSSLSAILEHPNFQRSTKPRILMTLSIRRIFNHISDAESLDLSISPLGQWCLRSLRSSVRELRIAAGRALVVFLRENLPAEVRGRNRLITLDFLKVLSERNSLPEQETLILAYGQVARACGDDELNLILIELVEYLGHPNPLLCGIAHNEITAIAEAYNTNPEDLLKPFWRSLGITVVKDLQNRPQKAQQLSDILGKSVNGMLLTIQTETLPYLVLGKRRDILQRIANARGTSIPDLCTQPRKNLAAILALLLRQPSAEQNAMEALVAVAPVFQEKGKDISSWVQLEPVLTACELLKAAAEEDESRRPQTHDAFQLLATLAETASARPKSTAKKARTLYTFFEAHILGIMAHFSEVLDNSHEILPIADRRRCVGAMGEMIGLAKIHVSIALPQIRACLQSAMGDKRLCDQTFIVWTTLLSVVTDEEDLVSLTDQTFALITQNWSFFSDETQLKAHNAIDQLLKTHNNLLRERIDSLPSLASIPLLSKYEGEIARLKAKLDTGNRFDTFSQRCGDENAVVVARALEELIPFLEANQKFLHESAISGKPTRVLSLLTRSILDASVRFAEDHPDIPILSARSLGIIGCLDPYRVEAVREKRDILVLSNFERATEVIDFIAFLLEKVLVKVFHSAGNARAQGFLAYVMQELLRCCGFNQVVTQRARSSQPSPVFQRWVEIPEAVRGTLTPFLSSRYMIRSNVASMPALQTYPLFRKGLSHSDWLRTFVFDLLQRGKGDNVQMIFPVLARIIKGHDLSIASFMLPFAALNVIVSGNDEETSNVGKELLDVLKTEIQDDDHVRAANIKQCSENVFQVLDYLSRWLQEKRKSVADTRAMAGKTGRGISEIDEIKDISQISCVEGIIQSIPAEVISRRAVECGSYARALYHWEQYMRQEREKADMSKEIFQRQSLLQHLQFIYARIDEPDSIEGISAHLQVLDPDQQIMEHRKAGRWTAAQSWYELSLAEKPNDPDTQIDLLTCLKESGQYDSLLSYVEGFHSASTSCTPKLLPFAAEAAWVTGKWQQLEKILKSPSEELSHISQDFNVGVGKALLALRRKQETEFRLTITSLRDRVAKGLSPTSTASLQASHDHLLKLHALYEIETISGISETTLTFQDVVLENLDRRLDVLGAYTSDKQYILGIRRAAMQLSNLKFSGFDIAAAWLTSARLARKANFTTTAFNSVLRASQLGDDASKIEYSRLLWKDGHQRKAIQNLNGAITSNAFDLRDSVPVEESMAVTVDQQASPSKLKAQAQLLLAKWLDRAGQTKTNDLMHKYIAGVNSYPRWDKGHYYLGRHYNKILEAEKLLPRSKQSLAFMCGETAKLVIDNYVRSLVYGSKYYYQTVPKILTLWLDLGMEVHDAPTTRSTAGEQEVAAQRVRFLDLIQKHIRKYTTERIPAYTWYTAFPQIITRISHPHKGVYDLLSVIILKVATKYPQQALWSLLAVPKATAQDRAARGTQLLLKLKETKRGKGDTASSELRNLIQHGQKLSDALLAACEVPVEQRVAHVSLQKDLHFNHKLAPCSLVVPIEATMIATLPAGHDSRAIRAHNPFPHDAITISSFSDDVLVLSSLQRPRKLTVRGSDGRQYGLLCKPKDDLRKDQRLMEFNAMINRALQRDIESSKRRLYIKTYGVTPLNEECGTIEWVEGLKPMRDIIIRLYRQKNIQIDYSEIRVLLDACCADPSKLSIFTDRILKKFPPVLYEWFIETFPEPEAWCAARLRYTRSCAVMSIVGHVLGLGDRHGENVLLQEGNGGTFHVDFNCLFDKGLTFEKPELVPFRLTHNMVDAMGPQGVEGPFRTAAELTYAQLRQHKDTLITILETFVHDPTADFLGSKRKKRIEGVPETPREVLECVERKVKGFLEKESVPLSVEGYVDALIEMAREPRRLAAMYIGWCSFF